MQDYNGEGQRSAFEIPSFINLPIALQIARHLKFVISSGHGYAQPRGAFGHGGKRIAERKSFGLQRRPAR